MRAMAFALAFLLITDSQLVGVEIPQQTGGPIHEAFVTEITEPLVSLAIAAKPPEHVLENPPGNEEGLKWIGGYWDYLQKEGEFIWVSGVYRKPPTDCEWVEGSWYKAEDGYVRLKGYWKREGQEPKLVTTPPPDPFNESTPTKSKGESFWVQGFWNWNDEKDSYEWVGGRWERTDTRFMFVPAHYVHRPEGYLFIPASWDHPLAERGVAYANAKVKGKEYTPKTALEPSEILNTLLPRYPDYLYLFYHNFRCDKESWIEEEWAPPWWGWEDWWTFPWRDHWALLWWWVSPGYPQPYWLPKTYARLIEPAPVGLVNEMQKITPPWIVTKNGCIDIYSGRQLLEEMDQDDRILKVNERENFYKEAATLLGPPREFLKPMGPDRTLEDTIRVQQAKPRASLERPKLKPVWQTLPPLPSAAYRRQS